MLDSHCKYCVELLLLVFVVVALMEKNNVVAFTPAASKGPMTTITSHGTTLNTKPFNKISVSRTRSHHLPTSGKQNPFFTTRRISGTHTALKAMLDVPPYFFTFTFPMLGILLSVSKGFGRLRMEERAWEQRLEEARLKRLREDPTLTELELRRKEAALEWSAYGKPRRQEEELERAIREEGEQEWGGRRRRGVKVMDREYDGKTNDDEVEWRANRMTDDEINLFEMEYGVEYDPYYDDPYTEDELPDDMDYKVDKRYGDRIYSNGEIFYMDKASGLFYRQGAKPRSLSFW
jgi:hypothetical protein